MFDTVLMALFEMGRGMGAFGEVEGEDRLKG